MKKKENISEADKEAWSKYIKNPNDLFDKDLKKNKTINRSKRYRTDFHGLTLSGANDKIRKIITDCFENGYSEILLITGKGLHSNSDEDVYVSKKLSKLKFSIPEFINSQNELLEKIISVNPAELKDGGEGAFVIKLKKKL